MWALNWQHAVSCGMWDLVPWSGIEPIPPAWGVQSLNHWTTRDTLKVLISGKLNTWFGISLVVQLVKNPPAVQETWVRSPVGQILWRRERLPTPVLWPGELHGLCVWSTELQRVGHDWATFTSIHSIFRFLYLRIKRSRMVLQKNSKNLNFFFLRAFEK